jgi:hypothetical protein
MTLPNTRHAFARVVQALLLAALGAAATVALAHRPSYEECLEGSDFIANAARARDNGISKTEFVGRMREDIEMIQAYPPQLRWFVQDGEDATFLIGQAEQVFDAPRAPKTHQAEFLASCSARILGESQAPRSRPTSGAR